MTTKAEITEAIGRLEKALVAEFELLKRSEDLQKELIKVHYEVLKSKEDLNALVH
jgi:hypothetical protein